jgi:hypothetical protein
MAGLRTSNGLTNLVVDTLRFRNFEGGILTVSEKGMVSNDALPVFRNLTVSGQSTLTDAVCTSLTVNSVDALASIRSPSAAISQLDASSAAISSLNAFRESAARLPASSATIGSIDVSSASIGFLDAATASIRILDVSSASIGSLNVPVASIITADISSASIGTLEASSATVVQLDVSEALVNFADFSSAKIGYLPQFDPSGNTVPLFPVSTTLPQFIAGYNQLLNLFASKNIFITLSPNIIFQTRLRIGISKFPTGDPGNVIQNNYTFEIGERSLHDVVNMLNNPVNFTFKLRFSLNNSQVSIQEEPGYSFIFKDLNSSANLFLNHIGLIDISCNPTVPFYPYTSLTGEKVLDLTGQIPAVPTAPTTLPTVENITDNGFTIVLTAPPDPTVKQLGLYIRTPSSESARWEAWLPSILSAVTRYRFNTPTLTTTTQYDIYISYLSIYDESPKSAGVFLHSHNLFDIMDTEPIRRPAPNVYSRPTKPLTSWPPELTKVSQIYSIKLTIRYRVNPSPIEELQTVLIVENSVTTIPPIFTKDEGIPYNDGIAEGGIVDQTYLYNDFNQWFITTDGDTIDKTKSLSFDWNFFDDNLPGEVEWIGPDTPDTCIINYSYIEDAT